MTKRILIADDHQVVIDGLSALVKGIKTFTVAGTAKNGWEVLDYLENKGLPDVLLMDITMPKLDGMETMQKIQQMYPDLAVIILSMHLSGGFARSLLSFGAKGYLQKDCDKEELVAALQTVSEGGTYLSKNVTELLVSESNSRTGDSSSGESKAPKITKRQAEILQLLFKEHGSREIAEILSISFNTVETHRRHLLNKFAVKSTVGLIREAMRFGIVE